MGYTHYTRGYLMLHDDFLADVQKIIDASDAVIRGWDGTGEPTVSNAEIRLNGDAFEDLDHETFVLVDGVNHSTFCKTARKPYDEVVTAILLRATFYSKRFKVSSDGDFENDWKDGRELYARVFGEDAAMPSEVTAVYA